VRTVVLPGSNLEEFLVRLAIGHELIVPQRSGASISFATYDPSSEVVVDYQRSLLPPKKFFLPPEEVLFDFAPGEGFRQMPTSSERRILFGLHPCDIHGLKRLDQVFLNGYVDTYYQAQRDRTLIIGLSCLPDDKCFCNSMGTDLVTDDFDLFLTDLGDNYLVEIGSTEGNDLILANVDLFEQTTSEILLRKYKVFLATRSNLFEQKLDTSGLSNILALEWDSSHWEETAEDCLACGRCSMSCPTCYCFTIFDDVNLDGQSGSRCRQWTSCLYKNYALVAGGHNFRPSRGARLRQRIMHKHKDSVERHGVSACVGCGRCQANCAAGINICQVLTSLRGECSESIVG